MPKYVAGVFGFGEKVHVMSPYVGGAFGAGLRPQYQLLSRRDGGACAQALRAGRA